MDIESLKFIAEFHEDATIREMAELKIVKMLSDTSRTSRISGVEIWSTIQQLKGLAAMSIFESVKESAEQGRKQVEEREMHRCPVNSFTSREFRESIQLTPSYICEGKFWDGVVDTLNDKKAGQDEKDAARLLIRKATERAAKKFGLTNPLAGEGVLSRRSEIDGKSSGPKERKMCETSTTPAGSGKLKA